MRRLKVKRNVSALFARTLWIIVPLHGQLMLLCCANDCGRFYIRSSLGLSLCGRCICHATNSSRPCAWCVRRLEILSHHDTNGIPVRRRFRRRGGSRLCPCLPHSPHVLVFACTCPPQRFRLGFHVQVQQLSNDVVHHAY